MQSGTQLQQCIYVVGALIVHYLLKVFVLKVF